MSHSSFYCRGWRCLKTTPHIRVQIRKRIYYYCVVCSHRLEVIATKDL